MLPSDIIQIAIGILAIVVPILIYCLQNKHEKQKHTIEENQKKNELAKELEKEAEKFLFDNEGERNYLTNCIIAANLHKHEKHYRKIYQNFCQCPLELQNEILKQAGFEIQMIKETDWVDICFEKLQEDIEKYKLGRNILYEGAKYFHYNFEYYKNMPFDIGYIEIIEALYPSPMVPSKKIDISLYIEQYLDYISERKPAPDKEKIIYKPIDYIWESFNSEDELLICKWVMVLVGNIVTIIYNKFQKNDVSEKWKQYWYGNSATIEDAYYDILFRMYSVYYAPVPNNNTSKKKLKKMRKNKKIHKFS